MTVKPRNPIPGNTATVHIEKGTHPVKGVTVTVNGKVVGETDSSGDVTFTVPYTETVQITVGDKPTTGTIIGSALPSSPALKQRSSRVYAVGSPRNSAVVRSPDDKSQNEATPNGKTYNVSENMTFFHSELVLPGANVTYHVTIRSTPVRNASALFNGHRIGKTSDTGNITFMIPKTATAGDTYTLSVNRGEINDSTQVMIQNPSISVKSKSLLPLVYPGQVANVTVTVDGQPISGATVKRGERSLGTTNTKGIVQVSLPMAPSVTLTATTGEVTVQKTVWKPFISALFSIVVLVGSLVGGAVFVYRYNITPQRIFVALAYAFRWTSRGLVSRLVNLSTHLTNISHRFLELLTYVRANLNDLRTLVAGFKTWIVTAPNRFGTWVRSNLWRRFSALLEAFMPWTETDTVAGTTDSQDAITNTVGESRLSIREAWRHLVTQAQLTGWRTMTPGEIADAAIRKGLPEQPVEVLTDAFRAVEYGTGDPDSYLERVQTAVAHLIGDSSTSESSDGSDPKTATSGGED